MHMLNCLGVFWGSKNILFKISWQCQDNVFQHHSLFSETFPEHEIVQLAKSLFSFSRERRLAFLAIKAFILMIHFLGLIWHFKARRLLDLSPTLEVSGAYNMIWMKPSSTPGWPQSMNLLLLSWVLTLPHYPKAWLLNQSPLPPSLFQPAPPSALRLTLLQGVLFPAGLYHWVLLLSTWKCKVE